MAVSPLPAATRRAIIPPKHRTWPCAAKNFRVDTMGCEANWSVVVAINADGTRVAGSSAMHGLLSVWNVESGAERRFVCRTVLELQFGPDGRSLAAVYHDHTLHVLDTASIATDVTIHNGSARSWTSSTGTRGMCAR